MKSYQVIHIIFEDLGRNVVLNATVNVASDTNPSNLIKFGFKLRQTLETINHEVLRMFIDGQEVR